MTVTEIEVTVVIVTEKENVTKNVTVIVTVIVREKESRKSQMVNIHSITTRTKWTTTIWRWWTEVRAIIVSSCQCSVIKELSHGIPTYKIAFKLKNIEEIIINLKKNKGRQV